MAETGTGTGAGTGTPAGAARRARLESARLYLCTGDRPNLATFIGSALAGGVDIVQLREKGLEAADELAVLAVVASAARAAGALVAVNDRADLAAVAGADVLHLGQRDLTAAQARSVVGPDVVIGVSTNTVAEGDAAFADPDVDYYCVGPVWATPTKPGRPPAEAGALMAADQRAGKPWFAIGGIEGPDRAAAVGAGRIVVVRAITEAADPRLAAERLRSVLA